MRRRLKASVDCGNCANNNRAAATPAARALRHAPVMKLRGTRSLPITRPGREDETVVYRADIDGLRAVSICWWSDIKRIPASSRRVYRGRYRLRYFRLPGHPYHSHADQNTHFLIGRILCAPDSADISGAPRRAGRYLPNRLRVADSNQISRQVRKVPLADIARFRAQVCFTPYKAETLSAPLNWDSRT